MKKILAVMLCTMLISAIPVAAEEDPAEDAAELLENVRGTYDELFAVTNAEEYDQIWLDNCAAAAGEDMAPQIAEALKTACAGTLYGQEAIDAYGDGSEGVQFDCFFINGVSQLVFDGDNISGLDENGKEVIPEELRKKDK